MTLATENKKTVLLNKTKAYKFTKKKIEKIWHSRTNRILTALIKNYCFPFARNQQPNRIVKTEKIKKKNMYVVCLKYTMHIVCAQFFLKSSKKLPFLIVKLLLNAT